jgi:type II secretory pathway pseudopilin PulG
MAFSTRKIGNPDISGMTILEALIAILILGFTTSAVVSLVVTGDSIAGRRSGLSYATIIAKNEAERLRNCDASLAFPGDTTYSDTINGAEYDVTRSCVPRDSSILLTDSLVINKEYSITVKRRLGRNLVLTFHVLQGFYGDQSR